MWECPEINYFNLIVVDFAVGFILITAGIGFFYSVDRGRGWAGVAWPNEGPPESSALGGIVNVLTGIFYICKALDWMEQGNSQFSLNKYWYLDYTMLCPLIILDLCCTVQIPHKARYFITTVCVLVGGIITFISKGIFKWAYFGISTIAFIPFAWFLIQHANEANKRMPPAAQREFRKAFAIFFIFWPMFPVLFMMSWVAWPGQSWVICEELYFELHAVLDIICKTVFGVYMMRGRLFAEDQELKMEAAGLKGEHAYMIKRVMLFESNSLVLATILRVLGMKNDIHVEVVTNMADAAKQSPDFACCVMSAQLWDSLDEDQRLQLPLAIKYDEKRVENRNKRECDLILANVRRIPAADIALARSMTTKGSISPLFRRRSITRSIPGFDVELEQDPQIEGVARRYLPHKGSLEPSPANSSEKLPNLPVTGKCLSTDRKGSVDTNASPVGPSRRLTPGGATAQRKNSKGEYQTVHVAPPPPVDTSGYDLEKGEGRLQEEMELRRIREKTPKKKKKKSKKKKKHSVDVYD